MASLAAVHEIVLIASSDGTLTADVRPLVRINVSVIVEQNGRREQGYSGGGGRFGLDELLRGDGPFEHGREAVRQALVNLEAVAAPAGSDDGGAGVRAGRGFCCTRPSAMAWKATSIARAPRHSRIASARKWRRTRSPWSTTARSTGGAAP